MSVSAAPSSAFLPLHKPRCAVAAPTRGSPNARSFTVTPWNVRCCDASPCGNVCRAATVTGVPATPPNLAIGASSGAEVQRCGSRNCMTVQG